MKRPPAFRRPRALAAALGLLLAGCAPLPAPPRPAPPPLTAIDDSDLLALVPPPVELVLSIDVARLRGSPWAKPVLASAPAEERTARASERGFDEMEEVDLWLIAKPPAGPGAGQALEILRGRFDRGRVRDAFLARHPGAPESSAAGTPTLAAPDEALAFLTERTVAFGPPAAVRAAIEAGWRRGRTARDEPWLGRVLASLDDEAGRTTSAVAVEAAYLPPTDVRVDAGVALGAGGDGVERVGARLFLSDSARLVLVASASDKYAAAMLGQALTGGVQALKGRRSISALGLRPVLDRLRLSTRGARVVGELTISAEDRDTVSAQMAALARRVGRPGP